MLFFICSVSASYQVKYDSCLSYLNKNKEHENAVPSKLGVKNHLHFGLYKIDRATGV